MFTECSLNVCGCRNRLGYFEWIEVLMRVAWFQYNNSRGGVAHRLQALLSDRILPKGGLNVH
jgi:hypothetical protein